MDEIRRHGDMGVIRRPPRGWIPGQAFAVKSRSHDLHRDSEGARLDTSLKLQVEWEVHIPGQEPYRFYETRKAPTWVGRETGRGKRWFSVRLKRTYGLMSSVGMPCVVDPSDPHELWIDWDAGYEAHEPAWKAHTAAAPERRAEEKARLRRDEDAAIARAEAQPVDSAHARLQDIQRLYALGLTSSAIVLAADDTGQAINGVSVARFELELEGGRRVSLEQAVPPRSRKLYTEGTRITVYGDPQDPDAFALG